MGSSNFGEVNVLTTAQDFTDGWVDVGSEIDTRGYEYALIWTQLDINNSENCRIRALCKRASAATAEYEMPIYSAGTTDIGLEGGYYEWTTDEDQYSLLEINLKGLIPYVQLQILAGTVGNTAGQLEHCYVHLR